MLSKLKKIRISDILSVLLFIFIFPLSIIYKRKHKNIWLVMESGFEARDNGYWLYKYIIDHEFSEVRPIFVITQDSPDFHKISELGEYVEYKSLKHWLYYFSAKVNISTHKAGNPNAFLFYILEVILNFSKNRVFLQHGITLSNAKWLYKKNTNFKLFVCAAQPEYDYIKENFGYEEKEIQLLGFPRFDTLIDASQKNKTILIMPSWRSWLVRFTDNQEVSNEEVRHFQNSLYFEKWNEILSDEKLLSFCEKNGISLAFYPHRNIQPFLKYFHLDPRVNLLAWESNDIQELLRTSNLLITDYSSVSLDFSYMRKPVIYYQFDVKDFREKQYEEGYFNYEEEGFGKWSVSKEDVIDEIMKIASNDFRLEDRYLKKINDFFLVMDKENCRRNYIAINELIQNGDIR